jgi:hypothetical protein
MQVIIEITNPLAREQTMTKVQDRAKIVAIKELLERDEDFVRSAGKTDTPTYQVLPRFCPLGSLSPEISWELARCMQ